MGVVMSSKSTVRLLFDNICWIGFASAFLLVMLSFSMKAAQPEIFKYVAFYIATFCLGIIVLLNPGHRKRLPLISWISIPFLLYWLIQMFSFTYSEYRLLSVDPFYTTLAILVFFLAILTIDMTDILLRNFVVLIYFISFTSSLYGFIQFLGFDPIPWKGFEGRVFSTFGHPNFYATYLIFSIPIVFFSIFIFQNSRIRFVGIFVLITSSMNLMFSRSRSAWLSLFVVFLAFLIFRRTRQIMGKGYLRAIVVLSMILFLAIPIVFHQEISGRIVSIFDQNDPGMKSRLVIYKSLLPGIIKNPLLGSGIGTFSAVFPMFHTMSLYDIPPFTNMIMLKHAHSEYLEILTEIGLLGLLIFFFCILFIYYVFWQLYHSEKEENCAIIIGITIGLTAILVQSFVSVSFRFMSTLTIFWSGVAILITRFNISGVRAPALLNKTIYHSIFIIVYSLLLVCMVVFSIPSIVDSYYSEIYLRQAQVLSSRSDYKQAITMLQKSVKAKPTSIDSLNMLGFSLIQEKRYSEAFEVFEKVLDINPHYPLTHYHLALIRYLQNDLNGAKDYLIEALKWRPQSWRIEELYGQIFLQEGNISKAKQHLLKATEINKIETTSFFYLGNIASMAEEYAKALEYYSLALNNNPNQIGVWQNVKNVNQSMRKTIRARKIRDKSLLDPSIRQQSIKRYCVDLPEYNTMSPSLNTVKYLGQSFLAVCDEFDRISIRIATRKLSFPFTFHCKLYSFDGFKPTLLQESTIAVPNVNDAQLVTFQLKKVKNAQNRMFKFEIAGHTDEIDNQVYLWINIEDKYSYGALSIDDFDAGCDMTFFVD